MKVIAITQARVGSSRLPGKVLKKINAKSLLEIHIQRVLKSKHLDKIIVATTVEPDAIEICSICDQIGVSYFRGSLENVLDRFYQTAKNEQPDYVVRLTSDCPLIDSSIIDEIIQTCIEGKYDYVSNTLKPTYPDGMDVEVFKFSALETAWKEATLQSEKEHVTPYIWKNSSFYEGSLFKSFSIELDHDYSEYRLTVDEQKDFELINYLIEHIGDDKSWNKYVEYLNEHPDLLKINSSIKRNEGYIK